MNKIVLVANSMLFFFVLCSLIVYVKNDCPESSKFKEDTSPLDNSM